jgi:hypothetical protein
MYRRKKELILESFQKMDINMLDVLLDDSRPYQDANKEVFIGKLIEVFNKFKQSGDTHLLPYKGFCNSKICPNKSCSGYSFVGNSTKDHIDLIFEETKKEFVDIYHCNGFETNDTSIERLYLFNIEIRYDELADFHSSIDYSIMSQQCTLACEELFENQNNVIDKVICRTWLQKHINLFESFDSDEKYYNAFKKFFLLYNKINQLNEILKLNDLAKDGVREFETLNTNDEKDLLKWLIKYEVFNNRESKMTDLLTEIEDAIENEYFEVDSLKINYTDFKYIIKFTFLFDSYYWDSLKKYSTFSENEINVYLKDNTEKAKYIDSLSYHLNKRGITV